MPSPRRVRGHPGVVDAILQVESRGHLLHVVGVLARPPAMVLVKRLLGRGWIFDRDPRSRPGARGSPPPPRPPWLPGGSGSAASGASPASGQLLQGPLDPPAAGHGVQFGLAQAVVPHQPIAFGGAGGLVAERVAVDHLPSSSRLLPQRPPSDLALATNSRKARVFAAGPRQHGDEPALALVQVGHVLAGGQLAVGHVEEVAPAGQLAEQVPGVAVRLVVHHVAACGPEVQRHAAVGGDREDEQELLQVGTMVLVVAEGDGQVGRPRFPSSAASA